MVDNVTVVTALDELHNKLVKLTIASLEQTADLATLNKAVGESRKLLGRRERRLATVTATLDRHIGAGQRVTPALQRLSKERRALATETRRDGAALARKEKTLEKLSREHEATERRVQEHRAHRESLESRRTIFRHDVELDSIFALLKVGLVFLVTYALKEYLGAARMEPVTFLDPCLSG